MLASAWSRAIARHMLRKRDPREANSTALGVWASAASGVGSGSQSVQLVGRLRIAVPAQEVAPCLRRDGPVAPTVQGDGRAGRYLGMSERWARGKRLSGELKSFRLGNRIMYHLDDLDAYIERARKEAEPEPEPEPQRPRRRRRRAAA